jgi:hypothetical protein
MDTFLFTLQKLYSDKVLASATHHAYIKSEKCVFSYIISVFSEILYQNINNVREVARDLL